jgi:hypothetical protein
VIVALVLVTLAWRSEASDRHQVQHALVNARAGIAYLHRRLAATRKRLASAEALTERQAAILSQAAIVLRQVDPLLTEVDHLQQITGDIQS